MGKFGDFGGFHFSEAVSCIDEFVEVFAGSPSDLAGDVAYLVSDCRHKRIISFFGDFLF